MKKTIFLLMSLFSATLLFAQVPDNDRIKAEIENPQSKFFYPDLMARYQLGDTTLTVEDYHYLYYGFAYSPKYNPLEANELSDSALLVLQKNTPLTKEELQSLIVYANRELEFDPFSPRTLNLLTYVYGQLGDSENEFRNFFKMKMVINTIRMSGTGYKEESPMHVLYFNHPVDVITSMKLQVAKRTVVSRSCEHIQLYPQRNMPKSLFFDFSRIYWKKTSNYDQKKPRQPMRFNYVQPSKQ